MSQNYVSFGAAAGGNMAQLAQNAVFSTDQVIILHLGSVVVPDNCDFGRIVGI
jgi:hypothetical protein